MTAFNQAQMDASVVNCLNSFRMDGSLKFPAFIVIHNAHIYSHLLSLRTLFIYSTYTHTYIESERETLHVKYNDIMIAEISVLKLGNIATIKVKLNEF